MASQQLRWEESKNCKYKLCWEGFPVLITGVSDKQNTFHPISISVTTGETSRDYAFIFNALKISIGLTYKPTLLIADASEAITNGFSETFGTEFRRAFCSFHVMKNVDSNRHLVSNKVKWMQLRSTIAEMQLQDQRNIFKLYKSYGVNFTRMMMIQKYSINILKKNIWISDKTGMRDLHRVFRLQTMD